MSGFSERIDETKYEVLEKLREGGMGAIYKVRHRALDQVRVIKVLLSAFSSDSHFQERFLQEARLACRMLHPNIAQIHDFHFDKEGTAFLVMEFIEGVNLAQLLQSEGPPEVDLVLEISEQSLRAIDYLHGKDLVHRDISPDNLMLTRDGKGKALVKLIDLGIAKPLQRDKVLTATGLFLGKLHYASPEQFGGADSKAVVGPASDLYSFGVVLYQLLTGDLPFEGTDSQIMAGHLFHQPRLFEEVDKDHRVPEELRAVVMRALAKKPEDRFESAESFANIVKELRSNLGKRTETAQQRPLAPTVAGTPSVPKMEPTVAQPRSAEILPGRGQTVGLLAGAEKLAALGHLEEATSQLESILSIDPDYEEAKSLFTRIKDMQVAPILGEASRFFVERRFAEALESLEKAREIDPGSERIDHRISEVERAQQKEKEEEERQRQARERQRAQAARLARQRTEAAEELERQRARQQAEEEAASREVQQEIEIRDVPIKSMPERTVDRRAQQAPATWIKRNAIAIAVVSIVVIAAVITMAIVGRGGKAVSIADPPVPIAEDLAEPVMDAPPIVDLPDMEGTEALPGGSSEEEDLVAVEEEQPAPPQVEEVDPELIGIIDRARSMLAGGDIQGASISAEAAASKAPDNSDVRALWFQISELARRGAGQAMGRADQAGAKSLAPDSWSRAEVSLDRAETMNQAGQDKRAVESWIESDRLFKEAESQARTAAAEQEVRDQREEELESLRAALGSVEGNRELEREYARRIAELHSTDPIIESVREKDRQEAMERALEAAREGDRTRFETVWSEYAQQWPDDPVRNFYRTEALSVLEETERTAEADAQAELSEQVASEPAPFFEDAKAGVKFTLLEAGTFRRGCTRGDFNCFDHEKPALAIQISSPFYIAEVETTNAQFLRCVDHGTCVESSHQKWLHDPGRSDHPVTDVSWTDANTFCEWTGGRLPTEAEWEYSARGGADTKRFPWGNDIDHSRANFAGSGDQDKWLGTSPGGAFPANGYGLFDMAGNVREWVSDAYSEDYYRKGPRIDPRGPDGGGFRVIRDGSWYDDALLLRVSFRYKRQPKFTRDWVGFRCASDVQITATGE